MKTKAQKQKTMKELADTITVRNHVMTLLNGPRGFVTKDEVTRLRAFVTDVDEQVKLEVLALDAPTPAPQTSKKDLDMAKARAKMELEKKEATMRDKLTSDDTELTIKAEESAESAKSKGVVKRVLD